MSLKIYGLLRKDIQNCDLNVGVITIYTSKYPVLRNIGFNATITFGVPDEVGDRYELEFYLQDNGTSQTITWNAAFVSKIKTLPTSSIAGKLMYLKFIYSTNTSKWELVDYDYEGNTTTFDLPTAIHGATAETEILDADEVPFWKSVGTALRKITFANLKATLKSYFDGIYAAAFKILGYTTTASAASTTTLNVNSTYNQFFTGTTTQSVVLPDVTTLVLGRQFRIRNKSIGIVSVQSSGTNAVVSLARGETVILTCVAITGTDAASWDVMRENAGIEFIYISCSDLSTALTAGTRKAFTYFNFNFKLIAVYGSLGTVCTGSTFIFDINNGANSFLSTKLSIDASENTSETAVSAAVINATYEDYTANTEINIDFDQVGATIAGAGASVLLKIKRT